MNMMDGFSKDAVRNRLVRLGVSYSNKLWTKEQIDILTQNADKSLDELSRLTGRSVIGVKKKLWSFSVLEKTSVKPILINIR